MFYFELIVADTATQRQLEATTEHGPFVVEAEDEQAARMLVGLNYETVAPKASADVISIPIWDDPSASHATRLAVASGSLRPRQALVAGHDHAADELRRPELVWDGRVVARMIWWPCAGHDIYPFGDALLFDALDLEEPVRRPQAV